MKVKELLEIIENQRQLHPDIDELEVTVLDGEWLEYFSVDKARVDRDGDCDREFRIS